MEDNLAIKVTGLSKHYAIYEKPVDRLKQFLLPRVERLLSVVSPFRITANKSAVTYFTNFSALRDVSFEIVKGQTVGIIGKNGSGKSTLLQLICGTLNPSSGSIEINGRIAALLELGSGFNPEFTGTENVFLNASVLGLTNEQTAARFDSIAAFADIGDFIDQPVKTYSSGMMLRLAFAVIAHVDADILIIDEALSVGDAFFTQKCMRFLREFMRVGTVLFVSHDTSAVLNLCSTAILLDKSRVIAQGNAKEVTEKYLSQIYAANQSVTGIANKQTVSNLPVPHPNLFQDMRKRFINRSNQRNDIEVFAFDPLRGSEFGLGGARILDVKLLDEDGNQLSWAVGGESVKLVVRCQSDVELARPIIGFHFKDRLGQVIFADNTFLSYLHKNNGVRAGDQIIASFDFVFPIIPAGAYSFDAAIADGTQELHVQHHWQNDALILKVHTSSICMGLIAIPMKKIELLV